MRAKKIDPKKKPVKHFVPIFTGLFEYVERGDISPLQLGVYLIIHSQTDFATGIWWGSAPKILAHAPRDNSLQSVQRAIRHLVEIGLLKHFHVRGTRGNFAHLLNKYVCRSGELTGRKLNADKSTSLDNIVYEGDAEREPLVTQRVTHLQEVRSKK